MSKEVGAGGRFDTFLDSAYKHTSSNITNSEARWKGGKKSYKRGWDLT